MIMAPLLAVSLVVTAATGPLDPQPKQAAVPHAALQSAMHATTDCLMRTIAADPRSRQASADAMMGELIVDSMPACAATVREMIDAYDASFGDGTGERFFMGPYLDVLPTAASRMLKAGSPAK
ncbi:MAG: hypothetical protein HXX10_24835 [Rhodoplanes sp.]|uniref:hypothetical protein n=1 Tax=Rhodoplanes sp. TaxID=1968906 RepID=UPI0017F8DE97|nr:hypothetical protein [Rhodoplanes sp.]NVO17265.1 hypothetical protein [Rhodoplanes sp.]